MTYVEHAEQHWPWEKVGRCVYCGCGLRFGQGDMPKTQEQAIEFAQAMDDVLAYGKDHSREKRIEAGWPNW